MPSSAPEISFLGLVIKQTSLPILLFFIESFAPHARKFSCGALFVLIRLLIDTSPATEAQTKTVDLKAIVIPTVICGFLLVALIVYLVISLHKKNKRVYALVKRNELPYALLCTCYHADVLISGNASHFPLLCDASRAHDKKSTIQGYFQYSHRCTYFGQDLRSPTCEQRDLNTMSFALPPRTLRRRENWDREDMVLCTRYSLNLLLRWTHVVH